MTPDKEGKPMLKRILSVLLCAALLLGGTALAAKEDDYTLPELLYQQFAVQDYPIRGSVAVTASGTASWLDFLLPLTASTLHVRLLNLENSDDFQYQVFSQDDSGSQQGLTQHGCAAGCAAVHADGGIGKEQSTVLLCAGGDDGAA